MQNKWPEERLAAALDDVEKFGSIASAAREHGIPPRTLQGYALRAGRQEEPEEEEADPLVVHLGKLDQNRLRDENRKLLERLAESEERNRFGAALNRVTPAAGRVTKRFGSSVREGTAVILASDWHVEESVSLEATAGRNEYNLSLSEVRMERFFDGAEWLVKFNRNAWEINDVVLWLGGDLITGYIHEELEESNELSPVEAIIWLKARLVRGIKQLLVELKPKRLIIPTSHGNHGRTTKKKRIKTSHKNSYEWMLYHLLAADFEHDSRVEFVIPEGSHTYVDVYDFNLHFTHGDEVKYGGGIGGLAVPVLKRVFKWDKVRPSDYHHMGHFHQLTDLGNTVVNGSLIGYTDFAMSIGADYEPPQQGFYILDSERGKTNVSPIWVGE